VPSRGREGTSRPLTSAHATWSPRPRRHPCTALPAGPSPPPLRERVARVCSPYCSVMAGTLHDEGLKAPSIPHRLFKRPPPLLVGSTPPPRRHGRRRAELPRPSLLRSCDHSSVLPRSYRSSKAHVLPRISWNLAGRLDAAAAADPLRRPRSPPASQPPTPAQVNPR
jgi:hypothetical protein